MRSAAMFEQENALPCAELQFSFSNRHCFAGARQYHADVRRHIIAAFRAVLEIARVFRHEPLEEFFQVAACGGIGIFHDDNAATSVLNKYSRCSFLDPRSVDLRLHFVSDFVKALTMGPDFKLIVMDAHCHAILCMCDPEIKIRLRKAATRRLISV
jgi:hypothetical protein